MTEPVLEAPPTRTRAHQSPGLLPALQSLLYVLIISIGLITFTVQPIRIPSGSMEPTLLVGDFLLLDKQAGAPHDPFFLPPLPSATATSSSSTTPSTTPPSTSSSASSASPATASTSATASST